jgi:hypothetical protein
VRWHALSYIQNFIASVRLKWRDELRQIMENLDN